MLFQNRERCFADRAEANTLFLSLIHISRLGFNSKAIITGDVTQIDLPDARRSGLVERCV